MSKNICDKYHHFMRWLITNLQIMVHIYALRHYCCCAVAKLWMAVYFGAGCAWLMFVNPGEMLQSVVSNLGLRRLSMLQLFDTMLLNGFQNIICIPTNVKCSGPEVIKLFYA